MSRKWKKRRIVLNRSLEARPLPIISDSAVAQHGLGEGRLIPLVIIDTSSRADIDDLVRLHDAVGLGDVTTYWASFKRKRDRLDLILRFHRPGKCVAILEFDVANQYAIVDMIVRSQSLYLQPGRPGDRLRYSIDKPKILVEIPSRDFASEWDGILHRVVAHQLRKRGLTRQQARASSEQVIHNWRQLGDFRFGR